MEVRRCYHKKPCLDTNLGELNFRIRYFTRKVRFNMQVEFIIRNIIFYAISLSLQKCLYPFSVLSFLYKTRRSFRTAGFLDKNKSFMSIRNQII